jgi:single-strand DNA-binding protein
MDTLTVTGNLTGEVELRTTAAGHAVATMRIASNTRRYDKESGGFRDGDPLYINVTCWRNLGVNAAASLRKGDSVIVTGRLTYRSYDDKEGNKRSVHEIDAISVGPDLLRWPVDIRRTIRAAVDPATAGSQASTPYPADPSHDDPLNVDPLTGEISAPDRADSIDAEATEKVAAA